MEFEKKKHFKKGIKQDAATTEVGKHFDSWCHNGFLNLTEVPEQEQMAESFGDSPNRRKNIPWDV